MSVNKALQNILEGKLDDMRSNFSSALSTKAVEKLEERKIEIAQAYFGQVQEEVEELDERTVASKKAKKGTKYKVQAKNSDSEGSYVELRQGKRVKDRGDYDRNAGAYFMGKGTYNSAKDMLNTVKEGKEDRSENLRNLDAKRKEAGREANNRNTDKYRQKSMRHQDLEIMRAGKVITSQAKKKA